MQLRSQPANHRSGNAALAVEDGDKASRMQHLLHGRSRGSIADRRRTAEIQTVVSETKWRKTDRSAGEAGAEQVIGYRELWRILLCIIPGRMGLCVLHAD